MPSIVVFVRCLLQHFVAGPSSASPVSPPAALAITVVDAILTGTLALYIIVLGLNVGEMEMPLSTKPGTASSVLAINFAFLDALADARVISARSNCPPFPPSSAVTSYQYVVVAVGAPVVAYN